MVDEEEAFIVLYDIWEQVSSIKLVFVHLKKVESAMYDANVSFCFLSKG